MNLRSLFLQNFRLYEEALFRFSPSINIICGENAKGKTALLEALYVLMTGHSFRPVHSSELIRKGASSFYLEACFVRHEIEQTLKFWCNGKERKIIYNHTPCPSSTSLFGLLKGVVYSPDDADLIKGAPHIRRQFLDDQIVQSDPLYVHYLTRFHRAMRQRNCLLRSRQLAGIENWEQEMAVSAAYMTFQRYRTGAYLKKSCGEIYQKLSGEAEEMTLSYKSAAPAEEDPKLLQAFFLKQYEKLRPREIDLGYTLTGPHKDDLGINHNVGEMRLFASEGQQRTGVAAMRLAEWERLRDSGEEKPLMLIDEIGTSLDNVRNERLLKWIGDMGQVFITTTRELPIQGQTLFL